MKRDDWTSRSYKQRRAFTMKLLQTYGWVCCICGLPIKPGEESCQHLVPRSQGGTTSLETCRPAHRKCNYQLQDRPTQGPAAVKHQGLHKFMQAQVNNMHTAKT